MKKVQLSEVKVGDTVFVPAKITEIKYKGNAYAYAVCDIKDCDGGDFETYLREFYIAEEGDIVFEPKAGEECQCKNGRGEQITVMPVQTAKGLIFVSVEHGFIITDACNFSPLKSFNHEL
jgi:hypothetical protein